MYAIIAAALLTQLDGARPVPQGAKLSIELEKSRFYLGEHILVHFRIDNVGTEAFKIDLGGDYRGSSRSLRFRVEAFDRDGKAVEDPDPYPMCMGGLSWGKEIKPGETHHESLSLHRYRRFEKAGKYRLRVSHHLGWKESDPSKFPFAETTVEVLVPTEKEAERIAEEAFALPKGDRSSGTKTKPFADFTAMSYAIYLPHMVRNASLGDVRALEAISAMPVPEATTALIRLLDHKDPAFVREVLSTFRWRIPDADLGPKPAKEEEDYQIRRRRLIERAWRADHGQALLKAARRILETRELDNVERAVYLVRCVGGADELPLLAKAWQSAAERPDARVCRSLAWDVRRMLEAQKDLKVISKPETTGERLLFAQALAIRPQFRPAGWETVLTTMLKHELAYVRELALDALPVPPPREAKPVALKAPGDKDRDVRLAALRLARRWQAPEFRAPVLGLLRGTKDEELFRVAADAVNMQDIRWDAMQILVARLDDEGWTTPCLVRLYELLVEGSSGYGCNSVKAEVGRECQRVWKDFLAQHGAALRDGKRFKLNDPAVPLPALFPEFDFPPVKP